MLTICQTPRCSQAPGGSKFTRAGRRSSVPSASRGESGEGEGHSADLVPAPRDRCQWRLSRGRAAAASARASPLLLPSCLPHFWHRLAWLPAPGTRRWAGGWCCCDLAPSRLPISRGRQPEEQRRSLKRNLWLSGGVWRWSPRFETVCLRVSRSPSDARKMHVPVFKPPALKTPLTTQPIKLAFLRQLAHN